jgi:hypothetical protein
MEQGQGASMLAADSAMSAAGVEETIKEVRASVSEGRAKRTVLEEVGSAKKPRFQRLMWSVAEAGVTPAATYTEIAAPVPAVPDVELKNESITDLINKHPGLFKIATPLKADELEKVVRITSQSGSRIVPGRWHSKWVLAVC